MALILSVKIVDMDATKKMKFDANMDILNVCRVIGDHVREFLRDCSLKDYGLFMRDGDSKNGVWLDLNRTLHYYMVKSGDVVEFRKKIKPLKVRMLDGTVKTLLVDDSQNVSGLMIMICSKLGIINHEEYSLIKEKEEEQENVKPNFGTLTLRRRKGNDDKQVDTKMETLRKKLKTDDELGWLDHNKTLREQDVDEGSTLLLRRKFFFSDKNIDSRDPVQLNLLYVQCRDAIVNGTHPVTEEKACQLAGIQCQIQFSNYQEDKHRAGFIDLREFVPQSFVKTRGIERKVINHHQQYVGLSELDAKEEYVRIARSLPTYGVSFFLVKEKQKGRNKLVPRLIGITKEGVLRLDEKTKEIIQEWPLTTVRRWAASPNTFTFDFGDYTDQYYSVQTCEGEQIAQLIGGYIDNILRKQKAKDWMGVDKVDDAIMLEESVSPSKATIIQQGTTNGSALNESRVANDGMHCVTDSSPKSFSTGGPNVQHGMIRGQVSLAHPPSGAQKIHVSSLKSEPQKALINTIEIGQEAIDAARRDLDVPMQFPEIGCDPASMKWKQTTMNNNKQGISSHLAAMNAATAQVVSLTSATVEEMDHIALGAAISTITNNLPPVTHGAKTIAALMDDKDSGDRLLDATRHVCDVFGDLLTVAGPEFCGPHQNLLNAASKVGEASGSLLDKIVDRTDSMSETQDILLGLSKAVANATAALILQAKNVASHCPEEDLQNRVIGAATRCALSTSQLVAIAKVVAPTIRDVNCQQQMVDAAKEVANAVDGVAEECGRGCFDESLCGPLNDAANAVSKALSDLLNHVKSANSVPTEETSDEACVETIITVADKIFSEPNVTRGVFDQASVLAKATSLLIHSIKGQAEASVVPDNQQRLLTAAKVLTDATARLVSAAKQAALNPKDVNQHECLRDAAQNLGNATKKAAADILRRQIIKRLENTAKQAADSATQCIAAAQSAASYNSNPTSQHQLLTDCKQVSMQIPKLVESIKMTLSEPDSSTAQSNLLQACRGLVHSGTQMVESVNIALPTIKNDVSELQLSTNSKKFHGNLAELQRVIARTKGLCGGLEVDAAIDTIRCLDAELEEFRAAADAHQLKPLPGEDAETAAVGLNNTRKIVGSTMTQLLTAASEGQEDLAGEAARQTANALTEFNSAVRAVAATCSDRTTQYNVIGAGHEVLGSSIMLLEEVKVVITNQQAVYGSDSLRDVVKGVSTALNLAIGCIPGQSDADSVLTEIKDRRRRLSGVLDVSTDKSHAELQEELTKYASKLNKVTNTMVHVAKTSPSSLKPSIQDFGAVHREVLDGGMEMAALTQSEVGRKDVIDSLKSLSDVSIKMVSAAKAVLLDPNAPNLKNNLTTLARMVIESINGLVNACSSATPGQRECDNAIRQIQGMSYLSANPIESVNDGSYFDCLETVMNKSRLLGDGMTGIANHTRSSDVDSFSKSVNMVSDSVCDLLESAGQASYLIAVSDPTSVAPRPGLVDQNKFCHTRDLIHQACNALNSPNASQQQVLSSATQIAKHTSTICTDCRTASGLSTKPITKRHFVQAAKDVANATAALVKQIKALDQDYSDKNREKCAEAVRPLLVAVDSLCNFANSPEFASVPAKISVEAQQSQQPIADATKLIIGGSSDLISAAKELIVNNRDPVLWQSLANHSKDVSDSIKSLVSTIRDKAPGQKECDEVLEKLKDSILRLDQAGMSIANQTLSSSKENSLENNSDRATNAAAQILTLADKIRFAGKAEAETLGHRVSNLASLIDTLVPSIIGMSSHMINTKQQMGLIDQTKTLLECGLQTVDTVKQAGGNPKAIGLHPDIDEAVDCLKDASQDLLSSIERQAASAGLVSGVVETINSAMVHSNGESSSVDLTGCSFVDFQSKMVSNAKEISKVSLEMVRTCSYQPELLGHLSSKLSQSYCRIAVDAKGAVALSGNVEVSNSLHAAVQDLGQVCVGLVKAGGVCQSSNDKLSQDQVSACNKNVQDKVSQVLAALKAGSSGTQACINAASTVSGIIGDLDTTIMFATAGTLPSDEGASFSDHRENILKTAKALVEDAKTLVAGAVSTQEQLAVAAKNGVATMLQLAEVVKLGASTLGSDNSGAQVMLMNAVRDVAAALGDLVQSTKSAAGKPSADPTMLRLKESAKIMVTNVTSLLKTIKVVEDEHTRGTRALEATIDLMDQEINNYLTSSTAPNVCSPEELIKVTRLVTQATAKTVAAGNSCKQEDIMAAVNLGRKAVTDLLSACKGASVKAENDTLRQSTQKAGMNLAVGYKELLMQLMNILERQSNDAKQALPNISRKIAHCVSELVSLAEELKGSDYVDADDPSTIAENELLRAASSIDMAAQKLAKLRPRKPVKEADEDMNFDELILSSCEAIARATSALVKAASSAQRELVCQGLVMSHPQYATEDGQWSEGLISAAKMVAVGTHNLCQAANSLVQGQASEELLISAAKQVAGSTAQLLVACKVKADPLSTSSRRLQAAGNDVKKATDNLVLSAQKAIDQEDERNIVLNKRLVGGLAQEMDAQSEILRKERELEEARQRLAVLRRAKYGETSVGEGDSFFDQDCPSDFNVSHASPNVSSSAQSNPAKFIKRTRYNVHVSTDDSPNVSKLSDNMANVSLQSTDIERSTVTEGPSFSESLKHFRNAASSTKPAISPKPATSPKPILRPRPGR